jgi:hypothetical protein
MLEGTNHCPTNYNCFKFIIILIIIIIGRILILQCNYLVKLLPRGSAKYHLGVIY